MIFFFENALACQQMKQGIEIRSKSSSLQKKFISINYNFDVGFSV